MIEIDLNAKKLHFIGPTKRKAWYTEERITLPSFTADLYSAYKNPKRPEYFLIIAYCPDLPDLPRETSFNDYDSDYTITEKEGALVLFNKRSDRWVVNSDDPIYHDPQNLIKAIWQIVSEYAEDDKEPDFVNIDKTCLSQIRGITLVRDIFGNCPEIYLLNKKKIERQFFGEEPDYDSKSWQKQWDKWYEEKKKSPEKLLKLLTFQKVQPTLRIIDDIYKSQHRYLGTEKLPEISEPEPEIEIISAPVLLEPIYSEQLTLTL